MRRKGVKFCGKRQSAIFYHLPQNEGKATAERVGFALCHSKVIGVRHREMDFRSVLDEGTTLHQMEGGIRPILSSRFPPILC